MVANTKPVVGRELEELIEATLGASIEGPATVVHLLAPGGEGDPTATRVVAGLRTIGDLLDRLSGISPESMAALETALVRTAASPTQNADQIWQGLKPRAVYTALGVARMATISTLLSLGEYLIDSLDADRANGSHGTDDETPRAARDVLNAAATELNHVAELSEASTRPRYVDLISRLARLHTRLDCF
jgi:hypothetical protein